jgi:ubiquinone/menaquinone biosynthesis C-methylase UbiE
MSEWSTPGVAEHWKQLSSERNRQLAPATEALFELARVGPGSRVLDLGTGAGDVAIMAAERVGPRGSVVATDFSDEMVSTARATVLDAGLTKVTVRRMDVEHIDLPDASFDAVLARMVLMFVDDLAAAFAGVARVLAPWGRFAATTWSALANNPFHAIIIGVARESGPLPEPAPELVRAFRLSDPQPLVDAAEVAGFREIETRLVTGERRVPSIAELITAQKQLPFIDNLLSSLDDPSRKRAWAEIERRLRTFEGSDGVALFPTEMLVFGATR